MPGMAKMSKSGEEGDFLCRTNLKSNGQSKEIGDTEWSRVRKHVLHILTYERSFGKDLMD